MKALFTTTATGTVLLFGISVNALSQSTSGKYEVGIRLSALTYQGDLTPTFTGSPKTTTFGFGVFATKILGSRLSVRANIDYNKIKGADASSGRPEWRLQRNFAFTTTALEVTGHMVYNLRSNYSYRRFAPYIFGGASLTFLKVRRDYSGFNAAYFANEPWVIDGLNEDISKTPPRFTVTLPLGAGFKYPLNYRFSLFGEGTYRLMVTDYLDGFSKSADSRHKDHYSNISVGLIYHLGNPGIACPKY